MAVQGSFPALLVLALTILLGSSALHSLMTHFAPQLHSGIAVLWLLTYIAAFVGLMFNHGINWISWLARYRILLVILLLGTTVSVSWSLDAAVSAERVVHLLGCSVLAIYIGFMVPLLTILRVTALIMGVIMLASIGAAIALPALGLESYEGAIVWRGILNSKNALGFWAAVAVLLYLTLSASYMNFGMKLLCYLLALASLYVLIESDSATSLLAMLVAGALSLYLYIAFRFQLGFIRMVVLALLLGGLLGFILSNIDTAQIVGRSGDLTGRGEVWRQTWKLIMAKPLTGYGYGSIWFPNDATIWMQQSLTDFTWVVYHAHNGFLQVASEIGLPLSCIALLMVAQQLIEIFYCQYERQQVGVLFVLAFVVAYLISNFSEARFLVNRELYWIFFIALPISMLRQINLISLNEVEEDDALDGYPAGAAAGYRYAGVPPDKPWLRPINQKEAARIGAPVASAASTVAAGQTNSVSQIGYHDDTEVDIQADESTNVNFDLGELDLTESGDHTLDTTRVETLDSDNTLEDHTQADTLDNASVYDATNNIGLQAPIKPYEAFDAEQTMDVSHADDHYLVDDTDLDGVDRYDMDFDDDDEGDDWVDIPLGDK